MFDVCTTCDTANIDMIFKFMPHTRQHRQNIDAPMLMHVWQGLEYHIDVCYVTLVAHIEHLQLSEKHIHLSCGCEQFH
jgi:hypothetical protein